METTGLVAQSRTRVRRTLAARERVETAASALIFAAAAISFLWLPAADRSAGFGAVAVLVLAYAAAARVQFEVGFAFAVPTQIVFVPMLFLAPLRLVPLLVALGFFLSKLPEHVRGEWHRNRIPLHLVSAWYAVGPVIVLAAAGSPAPSIGRLPILAAVLAAQFVFDFVSSAARGRALGSRHGRSCARSAPPGSSTSRSRRSDSRSPSPPSATRVTRSCSACR